MRTAKIERNTFETKISLSVNLDSQNQREIDTGCGFLDHMLTLFSNHANIGLCVKCEGDTNVDYHHTVEDIGICLGNAFAEALGDKKGICRYGNMLLPMDESLILSAVDFSGRGMLVYNLDIPTEKVGDFDTELVEEFFRAFASNSGCTLHITKMYGSNSHHIIEGAFKSAACSVRQAVGIDKERSDIIPSTKGVL